MCVQLVFKTNEEQPEHLSLDIFLVQQQASLGGGGGGRGKRRREAKSYEEVWFQYRCGAPFTLSLTHEIGCVNAMRQEEEEEEDVQS